MNGEIKSDEAKRSGFDRLIYDLWKWLTAQHLKAIAPNAVSMSRKLANQPIGKGAILPSVTDEEVVLT